MFFGILFSCIFSGIRAAIGGFGFCLWHTSAPFVLVYLIIAQNWAASQTKTQPNRWAFFLFSSVFYSFGFGLTFNNATKASLNPREDKEIVFR
jgi:uncharacterized membrane protein AbrB (regulator of aidB expression)